MSSSYFNFLKNERKVNRKTEQRLSKSVHYLLFVVGVILDSIEPP